MSTLVSGTTTLNDTITINKQTGTVVTFDTDAKYVDKDIAMTLNVKSGSVSVGSVSVTQNPTITVSDTGLITAYYGGEELMLDASVDDGWVEGVSGSMCVGYVTYSGRSTQQLDVATVAQTKTYLGIS